MSTESSIMSKQGALLFLQAHQPMPPDTELTQELIDKYDQVRKYFIEYPDAQAIGPLLNSFGDGDGFGVYQLVEDAIIVHAPELVIPQLNRALTSAPPSCQYWCAQIAAHYSDEVLLDALSELINNDNTDIREAAIIALAGIDSTMTKPLLKRRLTDESDVEVKELLRDILTDMEN